MNNTTTRQVIIIGHGNEALNAAIVMASLDKPVTLIGQADDISVTLDHYRFERQLLSLWDLYTKEQKISVFAHITPVQEGDCFASLCQADFDRAVIWVFMDMLTEAQLAELPQLLTSPHQQIILSGLTQIGQAHDLAQQFYSHWVYYFPLTFMKDGANFSSMLHPDVVLIGEKTPNSYTHSQELLFFIRHAEQHSVADITTVEFSRASLMTMLATRISFMNEMARLADSMGVDIQRVQQMMGLDKRIGKDFLAAGWGFGGRALPGKCYLSLHSHNSSANRGACKQNCRKKYTVIDQETGFEIELDNEYMMSPKDLCTLDFLDQVIDSGIQVLKIEGRGRAPEYVATVIKTYREAIDAYYDGTFSKDKITVWMDALNTVYNRGFWSGYYLGQELGEWSDVSGSVATQKKVYVGKGTHFFPKAEIGQFKIEAYDIKVGDKILVTGPSTGAQEMIIEEMFVNDTSAERATKGDDCTLKLPFRIRMSDKLYKIVEA